MNVTWHRRSGRAMIIIAMILLMQGCATGQTGAPALQADAPVTGLAHPAEPTEPMAASSPVQPDAGSGALEPQDERFLMIAEEELVRACMEERGFPYTSMLPPEGMEDDRAFPYGNDDVSWAREFGYGVTRQPPSPMSDLVQSDPNRRYLDTLTLDEELQWSKALTGTPENQLDITLPDGRQIITFGDGCVSEARITLFGDLVERLRAEYTTTGIAEAAYLRVVADATYVGALQSWSACMAERGYQFATPDDARGHVWDEFDRSGAAVELLEIEIAVSEAECAASVSLLKVASELEEKHREAEMRARESEVLAFQEQQRAAIERARTLLELES